MIVGIVGSEAAKFTALGEARAKALIRSLIKPRDITGVVSGGCHLGGIDEWTREICVLEFAHKEFTEYLPHKLSWDQGYRPRNLKIAKRSDIVHCITMRTLPADFGGLTHSLCYHCKTASHIKSGGCWTMLQARRMGKRGELHVIENV